MQHILSMTHRLLLDRKIVGAFVLLVVVVTLGLDIAGIVFPCPYCRTERFALGVLALLLLTRWYDNVAARYIAVLVGLYGLIVGIMQNFNHIKKINGGEFDWAELGVGHPFLLSALAVITLVWQLFLIFDLPALEQHSRR